MMTSGTIALVALLVGYGFGQWHGRLLSKRIIERLSDDLERSTTNLQGAVDANQPPNKE